MATRSGLRDMPRQCCHCCARQNDEMWAQRTSPEQSSHMIMPKE
jgi:hypothetical protein